MHLAGLCKLTSKHVHDADDAKSLCGTCRELQMPSCETLHFHVWNPVPMAPSGLQTNTLAASCCGYMREMVYSMSNEVLSWTHAL